MSILSILSSEIIECIVGIVHMNLIQHWLWQMTNFQQPSDGTCIISAYGPVFVTNQLYTSAWYSYPYFRHGHNWWQYYSLTWESDLVWDSGAFSESKQWIWTGCITADRPGILRFLNQVGLDHAAHRPGWNKGTVWGPGTLRCSGRPDVYL